VRQRPRYTVAAVLEEGTASAPLQLPRAAPPNLLGAVAQAAPAPGAPE